MMGVHNPDLQLGLNSVFDCLHFDWTVYGLSSQLLQYNLMQVFYHFNPDVVFVHTQSEAISIDILKAMSEKALVFNWTGDVRFPLQPFYVEHGRYITSTLFTNMNDVDFCRSNGINSDFLQVGFDSTQFNPSGEKSAIYPEILFMGSNYPANTFPLSSYRFDMVYKLKSEFGNRFGVYGGGWNGLESGNITSYAEEGKAYRSCKIAINLSHFAYRRYSSDRLFRILGSGAFCLTHNFPEIEKDFNVDKDLVVWNDLNDLSNKVRYYLDNESERKLVAIHGCLNARSNFTWHHFAQNLNELVTKKQNKENEQPVSLG